MKELLKPLYEKVEKVLKGETIGTINTGMPDAFVEVSKEFIGYHCFGKIIRNALLDQLSNKIQLLREQGIVKSEDICIESGDPDRDMDVALDLSQTLFPSVFCTGYNKGDGYYTVIDEMYAFLPCTDWDTRNVCECLGDRFKEEFDKVTPLNPQTTEDIYKTIIYNVGTPF